MPDMGLEETKQEVGLFPMEQSVSFHIIISTKSP